MKVQASQSEDHGIASLSDDDLRVYSVGISTGGVAEIRMARAQPKRHIVATTVDKEGVAFAKKIIAEQHLSDQIEAKLEDVAEPLPYADEHFDYIYARLVLHYLPQDKLASTLAELHRVVKTGGKLFIVVRSTDCPDAKRPEARFDPVTRLTAGSIIDEKTGKTYSYSRFFHTEQSISDFVTEAGFNVSYVKAYDEHLYIDFMHTEGAPHTDSVVELLGVKP